MTQTARSTTLGVPHGRCYPLSIVFTVVSPHLDDAALSLGATMHALTRRGHEVVIVTVFAGQTDSPLPPSEWDAGRRCRTAGEAYDRRRAEDLVASRRLGARPVWLANFGVGYPDVPTSAEIAAQLEPHLRHTDVALVPGWPLDHTDHAAVADALTVLQPARTVRYAELPYALYAPGRTGNWRRTTVSMADRRAKLAAVLAYRHEIRKFGPRGRAAVGLDRLLHRECLAASGAGADLLEDVLG